MGSPIRIAPPSRISARKPPRCTSAARTPTRVSDSRWSQGSHKRIPLKTTAPTRNCFPTRWFSAIPRVTTLRPGLERAELDVVIPAHRLDRLGLDEGDLPVRTVLARRLACAAILAIPLQAVTGYRNDLVDRLQRLPRRGTDEQSLDRRIRCRRRAGHGIDPGEHRERTFTCVFFPIARQVPEAGEGVARSPAVRVWRRSGRRRRRVPAPGRGPRRRGTRSTFSRSG